MISALVLFFRAGAAYFFLAAPEYQLFYMFFASLFKGFVLLLLILVSFFNVFYSKNLFNVIIFADVPYRKQYGFQDPATQYFEDMINFHHDLMFFLLFAFGFVFYMLIVTWYMFHESNSTNPPVDFRSNDKLEFIWTCIPAGILLIITIPSFALLYSMEEKQDPLMTMKIYGNQWYWGYEQSDYYKKVFSGTVIDSLAKNLFNEFQEYAAKQYSIDLNVLNAVRVLSLDFYITLFLNSCMDLNTRDEIFSENSPRDIYLKSIGPNCIAEFTLDYIVLSKYLELTGSVDSKFIWHYLNNRMYLYPFAIKWTVVDNTVISTKEELWNGLTSVYESWFTPAFFSYLKDAGSTFNLSSLNVETVSYFTEYTNKLISTLSSSVVHDLSSVNGPVKLTPSFDFEYLWKKLNFYREVPVDFFYTSNCVSEADGLLMRGRYIRLLTVDNVLLLPSKIPIRFSVTSNDVIHSWTIPSFGVKLDACPGRLNTVITTIKRNGSFYGQCSEICGVQHGFMPIQAEVVDVKTFLNYLSKYSN